MEELLRSEQLKENTWDLEKIYSSIDKYNKDFNLVTEKINNLDKYQGIILKNSKNLLDILKLDEEIDRILNKLATYCYRKYDEDLSNTDNQSLLGKFDKLYSTYNEKSSYIVPELLKSDFSIIENYIKEENRLSKYKLMLERIYRQKEHVLTDKEEKVLSSLGLVIAESEKIAGIIRNSELQFSTIKDNDTDIKLNNENFTVLLQSNDRNVRKEAFEKLYSDYSKYKETLAETLQGHVMGLSISSKLRNFKSSKEACLFSNRIDEKVYDNLIKVVHDRMDVMYDYLKLKKDVLKLDDFCLYDTYVNLANITDKKYSYDEAKEIVKNVTKVFGKEYTDTIEKAFNERWIDIYPNKSKRGGAYSSGCFDTVPYILLNYQNTYNDVSTLIHELGHSMHSYFSNKNNEFIYSNYKIFVAEVASTVNELLLNYYMLENSDSKEEKKYILSEMMNLFKATLFRQTMFSEFEEYIYSEFENGNVLTNDKLCNKYYELNKEYFGNDIIVNDEIKYEWERIPHFYYDFYVYQYATGLAAACYIVNRIRNKENNAVEDYLKFLSLGDSMDPIDELKVAGVDMLDEKVINKALDMFSDLIKEYRSLM